MARFAIFRMAHLASLHELIIIGCDTYMKVCLLSNYSPHYREEIYTLIDSNLQCDFILGDTLNNGIKSFDLSGFRNKVQILRNVQKGEVTLWQKRVLKNVFDNYDAFIVADDIRCLSTWIFLILCKLMGRKVYFWAHGWYGKESYAKRCVKKIFYSFPQGIFLYGNYAREVMIDNGFSPEMLWVIHNSLSYSKQKQIRATLIQTSVYKDRFLNNDPVLIFIGRLTAVKRLDMLIQAMARLKSRGKDCNLILVGSGPESENLRQCLMNCNLEDRVWLYGDCYDESVNAELIYNADLCVSPGNIGLTAVHVMTYGTPAITHDNYKLQMPEFEAIHEGITGGFYEYGSVDSLAETIGKWLNDKSGKRQEVRDACYNEIDTYWNPEYQFEIIHNHLR